MRSDIHMFPSLFKKKSKNRNKKLGLEKKLKNMTKKKRERNVWI